MSYEQVPIEFDKAMSKFYGEFSDYIYNNEFVGNGDMLLEYLEDADYFENWMQDHHPEYVLE